MQCFGVEGERITTWAINIAGLCLSTAAAVLMYYFPPRGVVQYTDAGEPHAQWLAAPTAQGKGIAWRQRVLSRAAPIMLATGFALQLVAAYLTPS